VRQTIAFCGLFCAALIHAQTAKPVIGCGDLRSLTNYQVSIATAVLVPATAEAPEHCRVTGQILPEVGFEVSLPSQWNGRFYMFGNGGYAGEALDSAARRATRGARHAAGYATAQTDTGPLGLHRAAGRLRRRSPEAAGLRFPVPTRHPPMPPNCLVRTYYGGAPSQSYFEGCSTGGRQG